MQRFAEHGDEVVVLTAERRMPGVEDMAEHPGIEVVRGLRGWWDWDSWKPLRPSLAERIKTERHNERMLKETIARFRPDVASVWNLAMGSWTLGTILEKQGVPIVLTYLDDWIAYAYTFDSWTRIFDRRPWARPLGRVLGLETRLPSLEDATATVASAWIAESIDRASRWKFPDAILNPIGVETDDFPISEPVAAPWSWRLMYSGRVVPAKGVATLVRALSHLPPEARLEIVGFAHERYLQEIMDLAREGGVEERITFSMAKSRQELRTSYRAADLVVFPSEWPEPFGIVPLEAMACGVPVLATGTGGSGEYLRDGENCVLFEPGNAEDLAAKVRTIAEDGGLRKRVTDGGTATAGHLTMRRFAEELERIHQKAAGV